MQKDDRQLSLDFNPRKLTRSKDPATSQLAAASAKELRDRHHQIILKTLRDAPEAGLTSEEIADRCNLQHAQVWRRMGELAEAGMVDARHGTRRNRSGKHAQVWSVCA